MEDGSVVTWGSPDSGGDSSAVPFAAVLEDGSVVTWGSPDSGGDSFAVQDQLRNL